MERDVQKGTSHVLSRVYRVGLVLFFGKKKTFRNNIEFTKTTLH